MKTDLFEKNKKKNDLNKLLKLYVLPIITIVIFVFILLVLTLPKIISIVDLNSELAIKDLEFTSKQDELIKLRTLSESIDELSNLVSVVRSIAPIGITDVVSFRGKVTTLISTNNLKISTQRLSESDIQSEGTQSDFFLREIPFIFDVSGQLNDIVEFINQLNTLDEFIVVKEMELNQSTDGTNTWLLSVNIVKYQFTEELNSVSVQQLFQNISIDSKISEEIKSYLERRL